MLSCFAIARRSKRSMRSCVSHPFSAGGLKFDGTRWSFKSLSDQTGSMRWTLNTTFGSDAAVWSGDLDLPGVKLHPEAIAVSSYGIFVAFSSSVAPGKKPPKLLHRSDRRRNALLIEFAGKETVALEGTVDTPDIKGLGVVAFPLPETIGRTFRIAAVLASGRHTIDVELEADPSTLSAESKNMVDQFDSQVRSALQP